MKKLFDTCNRCGLLLPVESLLRDAGQTKGYRNRCYECHREITKALRNSPGNDKSRGSKNATNDRKRDAVRLVKNLPCADCSIRYPYYMMDLDHLPGAEKIFSLGKYMFYTLDAVLLELSKCEAVCANCHRKRTHDRGYKHV